jgi:hypothetical protein
MPKFRREGDTVTRREGEGEGERRLGGQFWDLQGVFDIGPLCVPRHVTRVPV